jgi:hypothetical protein
LSHYQKKSAHPESDFNTVATLPEYPLLFKQFSIAIKFYWEGIHHTSGANFSVSIAK